MNENLFFSKKLSYRGTHYPEKLQPVLEIPHQLSSNDTVTSRFLSIYQTAGQTLINWQAMKYCNYPVPTLVFTGIGATFIPNFGWGFALGVSNLFLQTVMTGILSQFISCSDNAETIKFIETFPTTSSLGAPIQEEFLFRGVMQPFAKLTFAYLFPSVAGISFLANDVSNAACFSIFCTSVCFGLAHLSNTKDRNNYIQVIMTTISGIVFGVIAEEYGLAASIAAHVAMNTVIVAVLKLPSIVPAHESFPDIEDGSNQVNASSDLENAMWR